MKKKAILFRCDANNVIGIGHLVRCLLLANKFCLQNWQVHVACSSEAKAYQIEWAHKEITFSYGQESLISYELYDMVVMDGYHFNNIDYAKIKKISNSLCIIDDLANREYEADILVDPSLGRSSSQYLDRVNNECLILSGSKFAIVNPEYVALKEQAILKRKNTHLVQNVIICLGGGDQSLILQHILLLLNDLHFNFYVCMKEKSPFLLELPLNSQKFHFLYNEDIARIMLSCDIGIISGGMLTYEACVLGLPSIIYPLNAHQQFHSLQLANQGVALLCEQNEISPALTTLAKNRVHWHDMSNKAMDCVDGLGIDRIYKNIDEHVTQSKKALHNC